MAQQNVRGGFTLIEAIVVISIIVLMVGIAIPMLRVMRQGTGERIGTNAVAIAAATARGYSNRLDRAFTTDLAFENNLGASVPFGRGTPVAGTNGVYSGYAAIFMSDGDEIEIRLAENAEGAYYIDPSNQHVALERIDHDGSYRNKTATSGPVARHLNGFVDGPTDGAIDAISLNNDTGVAGVLPSNNPQPWLVQPPFAVWFDQNGNLVAGVYDPAGTFFDRFVYYDTDNNGNFNILDERERFRAVSGVVTYSKRAFDDAVEAGTIAGWSSVSSGDNADRWAWLAENGQLLMFSLQGGTLLKSEME